MCLKEEWGTGRCSGWHHAGSVLELWKIPGLHVSVHKECCHSSHCLSCPCHWGIQCLGDDITWLTFPVYYFFNNNTKHKTFCTLQQYQALTNEPAHTQMSYTMSLLHAEGQSDLLKATVSHWQRWNYAHGPNSHSFQQTVQLCAPGRFAKPSWIINWLILIMS